MLSDDAVACSFLCSYVNDAPHTHGGLHRGKKTYSGYGVEGWHAQVGAIVTVCLDMNQRRVRFGVNGTDFEWVALTGASGPYRFGVSLHLAGSALEIVEDECVHEAPTHAYAM